MHKAESHLVLPLLRKAIATATGLASPDAPAANNKSALWTEAAVESLCLPTWSVITVFGSTPHGSEPNDVAIQVYTQGPSATAVRGQLVAIHDSLIELVDGEYQPRRSWQLGTSPNVFLLDVFELEEGKILGNVDQARVDGSLNFILAYRRV